MDHYTEQQIAGSEAIYQGLAVLLQLFQEGERPAYKPLDWLCSLDTWSFITR
jgi:hypothetical protein